MAGIVLLVARDVREGGETKQKKRNEREGRERARERESEGMKRRENVREIKREGRESKIVRNKELRPSARYF